MSNKKSDFWYYTRRERNATLTLLITAILVFLLPALYRFQPADQGSPDATSFLQEITFFDSISVATNPSGPVAEMFYFDPNTASREEFIELGLPMATANTIARYREKGGVFREANDLQRIYNLADSDFKRLNAYIRINRSEGRSGTVKPNNGRQKIILADFDPNTVGLPQLLQLGINRKAANNLVKYRDKGGRFRQPEDLQKIYGIDEEDFHRLQAFIKISPSTTTPLAVREAPEAANEEVADRAVPTNYSVPIPAKIDVNQSSAADWAALYGIGPILSQRIVKFRDKLGGFHRIEQVAETYGLPDSTFQRIRTQLLISPITRPVAINKSSAKELQAHPYIQWQQANVLIAYRQEHGPYNELADLEKVRALSAEFIQRIAPYLLFN